MKKAFVFPLMFLYLLAASGLMVHAHYCGGDLASWELFEKADGCEGDCDSPTEVPAVEESCCKDKSVAVQITTEQQQTKGLEFKFIKDIAAVLPVSGIGFPENALSQAVAAIAPCQANAPPGRWQNIPLHKLHMRFTYYG